MSPAQLAQLREMISVLGGQVEDAIQQNNTQAP